MGTSTNPHFRLRDSPKVTFNYSAGTFDISWIVVSLTDDSDVRQVTVNSVYPDHCFDDMSSALDDAAIYVV